MPDSGSKSIAKDQKQAAAAYRRYAMANYNLDDRMYVAENGEVYIVKWLPSGSDKTIAERLSRTTFSHSLKAYPRRPPSKPKYRICFVDQAPPFRTVNKREVDRITRRLTSSTTEQSRRMHNNHGNQPKEGQASRSERKSTGEARSHGKE